MYDTNNNILLFTLRVRDKTNNIAASGHSDKILLSVRKVNKSYRGRSCPMILHCSDGVGRSGTYVLIDMVLNRMTKGSKEIDIAATLEHIRDQRAGRCLVLIKCPLDDG